MNNADHSNLPSGAISASCILRTAWSLAKRTLPRFWLAWFTLALCATFQVAAYDLVKEWRYWEPASLALVSIVMIVGSVPATRALLGIKSAWSVDCELLGWFRVNVLLYTIPMTAMEFLEKIVGIFAERGWAVLFSLLVLAITSALIILWLQTIPWATGLLSGERSMTFAAARDRMRGAKLGAAMAFVVCVLVTSPLLLTVKYLSQHPVKYSWWLGVLLREIDAIVTVIAITAIYTATYVLTRVGRTRRAFD